MYLALSYDQPPPNGTVLTGEYFTYNCGGGCDWFLTPIRPNSEIYMSLPYENQKYAYIYNFYSQSVDNELFQFMQNHLAAQPDNQLVEVKAYYYVLLTNELLPHYSAEYECLEAVLTGELEPDEMGGQILLIDFTLVTDQLVRIQSADLTKSANKI